MSERAPRADAASDAAAHVLDRRDFLAAVAVAGLELPSRLGARRSGGTGGAGHAARAVAVGPQEARFPLRVPAAVDGDALTLVAAAADADYGAGTADAWTLNGSYPAPTIRLRRGGSAEILLENRLPEPTILHWHGLDVPEAADGHPRLAIGPGGTYRYAFTVADRAGTYWYHPHTHARTAPQTYRGMAGMLLVSDDEEDGLRLPSGDLEIPLVLQDKRMAGSPTLAYAAGMGPDRMMGFLGDTPFANGIARPVHSVPRVRHRLRIVNASNARIFDLAFSDGRDFTLIGSDGGLLAAPVATPRIMLGTGERVDVLVDFSSDADGDRVMLRSRAFDVPGMMMAMGIGRMGRGRVGAGRGGMSMGGLPQGSEMDLLELVVSGSEAERPRPLPSRLSVVPSIAVASDTPRRVFRFQSMMMSHTINGRSFAMDRVDERVPLGRTEIWSFVNDSELPHPVHVHAGQFVVLDRVGGRNRVMPWERGLKDTVLLFPGERVDVAVRFETHTGVFLLHCHNLEHEDAGMMLNFEVVG